MTYEKKCIGIKLMKHPCINGASNALHCENLLLGRPKEWSYIFIISFFKGTIPNILPGTKLLKYLVWVNNKASENKNKIYVVKDVQFSKLTEIRSLKREI